MAKHYRKHIINAVECIKEFIDQNPKKGATVATLAVMAGISRNVLTEVFKELYREDIGEYKLRLRMIEAERLLIEGRSIKSTAIGLHYAGASSFSNAFRNYYNMSPSEWLRTKRNGHQ